MNKDLIRTRLAEPLALSDLVTGDDLERHERLALEVKMRPASVMIPVVARESGPSVLLTERTAHLHDHARQISFPGGRQDESDLDPIAAAIRETKEETGIALERDDVLGTLPLYHTSTGYRVTPVVAWLERPFTLAPDTFEVADVFEVPLSFLLNPANHRHESAWARGAWRKYWAVPYRENGRERFIWGVTAGILVMLSRALEA